MIHVIDDLLQNPEAYRREVLSREFRSFEFPGCTFHGIALGEPQGGLTAALLRLFHVEPSITFFRKSPKGQKEPHLIHTDIDMGDWSAVLYLNPDPAPGDGTDFWTHSGGDIESSIPHERSEEGRLTDGWTLRHHVQAKFNRLVTFPSRYFHSRAIPENYGVGEDARLIQVAFGLGVMQCL
jgi:hypothetical protein